MIVKGVVVIITDFMAMVPEPASNDKKLFENYETQELHSIQTKMQLLENRDRDQDIAGFAEEIKAKVLTQADFLFNPRGLLQVAANNNNYPLNNNYTLIITIITTPLIITTPVIITTPLIITIITTPLIITITVIISTT